MAYDSDNIFAKILRGEAPAFKVYEDDYSLAFMDVMPQVDGHTLVIPKDPTENIHNADPTILATLWQRCRLSLLRSKKPSTRQVSCLRS